MVLANARAYVRAYRAPACDIMQGKMNGRKCGLDQGFLLLWFAKPSSSAKVCTYLQAIFLPCRNEIHHYCDISTGALYTPGLVLSVMQ